MEELKAILRKSPTRSRKPPVAEEPSFTPLFFGFVVVVVVVVAVVVAAVFIK